MYDIIIIGTGAGGGTLLYDLAKTGKKILVLERGDFLPKEKENWDSKEVFMNGRYNTEEEWLDENDNTFKPGQYYWVGGNTKMYGATLLRMRQEDFGNIKHVDGNSEPWPINYQDLEKYYCKAEKLYNVHGESGFDPTDPPRSEKYHFQALKHEPRVNQLFKDLQATGLNPFPLPTAVKLPHGGDKVVLDRFDAYPDPMGVKGDSQTIAVEPSLHYENVTLLRNSYVEELVVSETGDRITKVVVKDSEKRREYVAETVVLSAGSINSAAVLLRSKSSHFPDGIGNDHDLVGRNLMIHNNSVFIALSKKVNNTKFGKTIGINDFYLKGTNSKYPLGHIQMLGKIDGTVLGSSLPFPLPGRLLQMISSHTVDFWLTTEDLPLYENRITINSQGRIKLTYKRTNLAAHNELKTELASKLNQIGCLPYYKSELMGTDKVSHQVGTLRFGTDKKTSVLDLNCRVHDIENLYVVDGSFFVTSSSVNPALTIMANALRISDHLKEHVI